MRQVEQPTDVALRQTEVRERPDGHA